MNMQDAKYLEHFFEDIPFPIHKRALVEESLESSLPEDIREAIVILPDMEYSSKEEVTRELMGMPLGDDTPKKDPDTLLMEGVDDKMDSIIDLDEFTQLGDEEDHESV
jgi:hypothetical protein